MKMNMENYWPEHKVYLFGKLTFATDELENKANVQQALRHYFPDEDRTKFEVALYEYEQAGYFEVTILDTTKPIRYILTNVNRQKFRDELFEYLDSITLPVDQRDRFWVVTSEQYRQVRGHQPLIKWGAIYGDSTRFNYHPLFWELFFKPARDGQIKLKNFTYETSLTSTIKNGVWVEIPKEMLVFYNRPFAEFEIVDKKLQTKVSKPNRAVKYRVGIIVTKARKLQLSIEGKRVTLHDYKSEKSNTYRAARALYDANGESLAMSGLNLKTNSRTQLKGLIRNIGINDVLEELFVEYGSDGTVLLRHHIDANEGQYDQLLEYVKTHNAKSV